MVVTKYLAHKDTCELPDEDEFVRVGGRVGVVVECLDGEGSYPHFEVQLPSGRTNTFRASQISRIPDQSEGKREFYA